MATERISDDLSALLRTDEVELYIKREFITKRLFIDSAIRQALRKAGIDSDEEIVAHLARLEKSKSRHLDRQRIAHQARRAKDRQRKAQERLNETIK